MTHIFRMSHSILMIHFIGGSMNDESWYFFERKRRYNNEPTEKLNWIGGAKLFNIEIMKTIILIFPCSVWLSLVPQELSP